MAEKTSETEGIPRINRVAPRTKKTEFAKVGHAELEEEIQRLGQQVVATQQNEESAKQDYRLMKEVVDQLPIGITVQNNDGRFLLANTTAAANLKMPVESLIGASPADFLADGEAASRRAWEQTTMQRGEVIADEVILPNSDGDRTWLTSHSPARILDQMCLISSSVDITEGKRTERELLERAHIDKLTGLPDRVLIQETVESIIASNNGGRRFAIAFVDVDRFKQINDYYSHSIGDQLLVKFSQRITARLRSGDMLARVSGDEFLLLLDPFENRKQIKPVLDGILHDLKQPFLIEMLEMYSSCSIGISVYPEHGSDYETLVRNADIAMYQAKHKTEGDTMFFAPDMARAITTQIETEQQLRLAIRDHKICCAFQPKVDIHTREIVGFETLVRWRDDDGRIHPPGEFIGLAVERGLINQITEFVLAEALNSIDELDAAYGSDTTISVNIAAKQASDFDFMQTLVKVLSDSKRADRIMIELTEEAFIAKGMFQTKILPLLREAGVHVSIDDFGVGHSSLTALAEITADEIKIDRSFITAIHERPRNQSVLRAIESLGRALGMSVVAEGVETHEELTYLLAATQIRIVQGFYFSKPFFLHEPSGGSGYEEGRAQEAARVQNAVRRIPKARSAEAGRSSR